MRTLLFILVASLVLVGVAVAPAASAAPGGGGGDDQICVPGLTLCCWFADDTGIGVGTLRCM